MFCQQKAKAQIQRQDEEDAMQSHGAGNLANHVTIDKVVFGHGSAKCRETNT